MKVVLDNIIFSLQKAGGISGMFSRLISGLMSYPGVDVYVLERKDARSNLFRHIADIPEDRILPMRSLPLICERYLNPAYIKGMPKDEPYIFHSSYYRYCNDSKARNITTLHDCVYEAAKLRSPLATYVHSRQKREAVLRSVGVACVSNATKKDLRRFIPEYDADKAVVIPNAPLCDYREAGTEGKNMQNILWVGDRAYHKNFKPLVKALSGTAWRLVLCSSTLSSQERAFINDYLLPGQWEHHIKVDDRTLSSLYKTSRCLVYPSIYEGFGIPVVEAQAHGLPVIIGRCKATEEAGGGAALVLPDYTPETIRAYIASLDSHRLYTDLFRRGKENASRFRWADIVEAYVRLYQRALS